MSRRSRFIGVCAGVLILILVVGLVVRSRHTVARAETQLKSSAMAPMPTLTLVNGSGLTTSADVTLRALDGTELATQHVTFVPYSRRQLDLGALLMNNGVGAAAGSVVVMPSSDLKGPAILAVLSMTYLGSREGDFIDEEFAMPMPNDSQVLRSIADSSSGSPVIAISSLAETPQHVTIQCFGSNPAGFSKMIGLGAGQTLLTEACTGRTLSESNLESIWDEGSGEADRVTAVALTSDGRPGSFAAFGLSRHQTTDDRHFSSLTFSDPKMSASSSTIFTGVPVSEVSPLPGRTYVPQIFLANFSSKPAQVTVLYAADSRGTAATQQVWSGVVAAGRTTGVSLSSLAGDPNLQDSFLVTSNAAPGDLIAKLTAQTDGGFHPRGFEFGLPR